MSPATDPARDPAIALLSDAFSRISETLGPLLKEFTPTELLWRPTPDANSAAWLAWHLARVQDDHLAGITGAEQVWSSQGWFARFGLPYPEGDIGYGQTSEDVARFNVSDADLLTDYYAAVSAVTNAALANMTLADLQRVVDQRWEPPVTAAVRLVSVVNDITAHWGQIAYLQGLAASRR